MNAIIWKDNTITYKKENSIYTDKILSKKKVSSIIRTKWDTIKITYPNK